jgi:hypothetical protein
MERWAFMDELPTASTNLQSAIANPQYTVETGGGGNRFNKSAIRNRQSAIH